MTDKNIVFIGLIASSSSLKNLSTNFGYIAIQDGKIKKKGSTEEFDKLQKAGEFSGFKIINLSSDQFIIPGFVDCHTHAPQFPNIGLGLDRPLLEWLAKYTFPLEKKYGDTKFAAKVYDQVVQRLLKNGTTTACYFGSIHVEGTLELVKSAIKHHQRALIGKVSMNKENDAGYYNDTKKELVEVETFVKQVLSYQNELVEPVVTPRFAVSCDGELMDGLSSIAKKYDCRIQSHISENRSEIEYVLETNPKCKTYGHVYDESGILNDKCIMAHAVHLTDEELRLLPSRGVSIAHCPASNTRLKSGLCPVRRIIDANITVGLGTDVAGGDNASILDAIRRTMDVSMCLEMQGSPNYALNWKEAFYLATLGGAKALNLHHKIGNFDVGKDFDALLIDVYSKDGQIDKYDGALPTTTEEYAVELLQKFIFVGDDRNIVQNELVEPVVTPRFAVSCDRELMDGLSSIAKKYDCRIQVYHYVFSQLWPTPGQSHISENRSEIEYVLETNPNCKTYGHVYDESGILNDKCIMAHAVHLTDEELRLLPSRGVSIAHCPASNTRLKSGLCPVRRIIDANITVGLGTDVAGGDNASILDAIRRTMDVSMCLEMQGSPNYALNWKEAFYLATLGGAKALNLDHKIGNFDVGKDFDALLIDVYSKDGQIDKYDGALPTTTEEYAVELLQKFIFVGDDRNIVQVYVKGEKVKDIL